MARLTLLLVLNIFITVLAQPCTFSTPRTPTGIAMRCECLGVHRSTLRIDASVNVSPTCLSTCLSSLDLSCQTGSAGNFRSTARAARLSCCPRCGGSFIENICQRIYLEGRPLFIQPSEGCVNKVRGTRKGHAYACRCADGKNFEVPFFLPTEVDEDCLANCGRPLLMRKCKIRNTEGEMRGKFAKSFGRCCKMCGGVRKRGGSTCALVLWFGVMWIIDGSSVHMRLKWRSPMKASKFPPCMHIA